MVVSLIMAWFYKLLSQLTIWIHLWHQFGKFDKKRWCGATHNLHSREVLNNKCSFGCIRDMPCDGRTVIWTYVYQCFFERLKLWCPNLNGLEAGHTGRKTFYLCFLLWMDLWWEPLTMGLGLQTSYLVHYLLTVDLKLESWDSFYYWQLTKDLTLTLLLTVTWDLHYSWQLTVT